MEAISCLLSSTHLLTISFFLPTTRVRETFILLFSKPHYTFSDNLENSSVGNLHNNVLVLEERHLLVMAFLGTISNRIVLVGTEKLSPADSGSKSRCLPREVNH